MESEDFIDIPAHSNSGCENERNELHNSKDGPSEADSFPSNSDCREDKLIDDNLQHKEANVGHGYNDCIMETEHDKDLVDNLSIAQVSVELTETVSVVEKLNGFSSRVHVENGSLTTPDKTSYGDHKKAGSSILGKRARMTSDEQKPSVHVMYHSLTRASKLKLEELLQQWSEWHARHDSSSHDPNEGLESGEETYFPALHVGGKSSAVSFWIDNQTLKQSKEFVPLDSKSVPLYDRGYALGLTSADDLSNLEGGLIVADASRCFNCGAYNHALKDCPRPRDNVAVSNARKQHNSKRNLNPGSRNQTRYYQNTPGGKYDGLKPGVLDPETRKLLGLGELDPPPWLNRMREIGYPPGYLDPDNENQPSGITIYADEEIKVEQEEGEITEAELPEPQKKMTVEFPGINAPIPPNADERLWAAGRSSSDQSRSRLNRRTNYSSESSSRGHQRDQRWSRDYRDDGPPGCDPVSGLSSSSYPPRFGNYESSVHAYYSRGNVPTPRSPTLGRSFSERGRRSPNHDGSSAHDHYNLPYSSSRLDHSSTRSENRTDYGYDYNRDRDHDDHDPSYHNRYKSDAQHNRWR